MKYITATLVAILISFLIAVFGVGFCGAIENEPKTVIPAIMQAPNPVGGFTMDNMRACSTWSDGTCRDFQEPTDWEGPNLFESGPWILTYGERDNCTVEINDGVITMTKLADGWPPCGVSMTIPASVGAEFVFAADIVVNSDESEVYTSFNDSIFKPGTGTRIDYLTSKYPDMTVWLQTYSNPPRIFPITTVWKNIVIRKKK